ncbi:hypothetical protein ACFE04_020347 [Oxalis oulophora]
MEFVELKEAIEKIHLVDSHAHNIVSVDSSFPFIKCFTEAEDDALTLAPHSLSFKRSVREIAELYGCDPSLAAIEKHRKTVGLESITSKCFQAARISAVLIDDGLSLDKKRDIQWHKTFVPHVGRILRIERLAEDILNVDAPDGLTWTLDTFTAAFKEHLRSYPFCFTSLGFLYLILCMAKLKLELRTD